MNLIYPGLILMVVSLFMNTTVDGFYNLGKLAQQQNFLILGGFLFVAGLILQASKLSKSHDDQINVDDEAKLDAQVKKIEENVEKTIAHIKRKTHTASTGIAKIVLPNLAYKRDKLLLRLSVASLLGFIIFRGISPLPDEAFFDVTRIN